MKKCFPRGHWQRLVSAYCIIAGVLFCAGCSCSTNPQVVYKNEYPYFMALKATDSGDEKAAMRLFAEGRKKSNELTSRKCAESLTRLGNVKERLSACTYVMSHWQDEAALITVCSELERTGEYARIISYTENLDCTTAANELVRLRMAALYEKKDSRFEYESFVWMTRRALTSHHMEIYNRYLTTEQGSDEQSTEQQIMAYRVSVYRRSYVTAFNAIDTMLFLCDDNMLDELPLLISDMGKAAMYGSLDFYSAAQIFDRIVRRTAGESAFYANFYAGRLYDKTGRYPGYAVNRFTAAIEASANGSQYDNALWYLFNTQLRTSTEDILSSLNTFGGTWHNASYFDDFFESLSVLLLSHHDWQDFYDVWKAIDSTASEETAGKYAYISGRLCEEGLAHDGGESQTRLAIAAFTRVLNSGSSFYYKVCALERMDIHDERLIATALALPASAAATTTASTTAAASTAGAPDATDGYSADAEQFLLACAAFGFPQRIYSEWLVHRAQIRTSCAIQLSQFLNQCANIDAKYGVQALRIASYAVLHATGAIPRELLALDFPRLYADFVGEAAAEHELDEGLLYALIRSESFFDANVASVSGAQGLTQLMEATANDVARKLHTGDYNILDPQTNVRFGSFYLAELMQRTEKLPLLAIFAYNAGLTNVRRWAQQTRADWLMSYRSRHAATGISPDLFLEMLPFTETREYGRKIVSAAALYGWLYYGEQPADTVHRLMQ